MKKFPSASVVTDLLPGSAVMVTEASVDVFSASTTLPVSLYEFCAFAFCAKQKTRIVIADIMYLNP